MYYLFVSCRCWRRVSDVRFVCVLVTVGGMSRTYDLFVC